MRSKSIIDPLAPAERKITQKEYMAQKYGQQKLDEINQKIIEAGLKPTSTVFLTQKEYLRNAIDECAATSNSFDEFQSKLLEQFKFLWLSIVADTAIFILGEATGAINIDNTYELASSHHNDFKDLRADEDIVINQEWILNKLSENENE